MSIISLAEQANPWWRDPAARPPELRPTRRPMQREIVQRLVGEPRRATLLRGPRQVGKTTLLHQCIDDLLAEGWPPPNLTYFDFSDERFVAGSSSPRELAEYQPPGVDAARPRILLLDEITRAAQWAEWLKQAVDAGGHRVCVTDSVASLLREGTTESGVGRWDELELETLTYREFLALQMRDGEGIVDVERRVPATFERYLRRGGFPEHIMDDSLLRVWSRLRDDISGRAIRKDLAAAQVDTERVNHVFQYLVESSGEILDTRKLSNHVGGTDPGPDRRSLSKWLSLLEGTMLIRRLDRRTATAASRLRSRATPRYYAADHGLVMAFAPVVDPGEDDDARRRAFEALVYRHLRELERVHRTRVTFHREARGDDEIDFVVDRLARPPLAIEVKHSRRPRSGDIGALRARAEAIRAERCLLIYGGPAVEERDGVLMVPLRDFALDPERYVEP
jgi:uncharacterized protein